jgi:cyclopropane fatty-acyl-phospholipid synthase-like methyltransferase
MRHDYFAQMYAHDPDPWGFDHRWYEQRKFTLTLAALDRPMYRRGVEAGCANGSLTSMLASRCDELEAFDFVPEAVARARRRLAGQRHVRVRLGQFPDHWPAGSGDLVVWSEVAYYLGHDAGARAISGLDRWLDVDGTLVSVHYTGPTNYPRSGSSIGPWLDEVPFLRRTTTVRDEDFHLGVWTRIAPVDARRRGAPA